MNRKNTKGIALIYGNKALVSEFVEIFEIDRMHDRAPIKAILVEGEIKKYLIKRG